MAHPRGWPKERLNNHAHEHQPPHQTKRVNAGDDNWHLATGTLHVTDPKVSSHAGDSMAATCGNEPPMRPTYDDRKSAYMFDGRTDGKKG